MSGGCEWFDCGSSILRPDPLSIGLSDLVMGLVDQWAWLVESAGGCQGSE